MSDGLEAGGYHAITHNGETYIKLTDAAVMFSLYRKDIATNAVRIEAQAVRIAELEAALRNLDDMIVDLDMGRLELYQVSDFINAALEGGER